MPYNPLDILLPSGQIDGALLEQLAEQAALAGGAMAGGGLCFYGSGQGLIYVPATDPVLSSAAVDTLTATGGPAVKVGPGPGTPASGIAITPVGAVTPPGGSPGTGIVFPVGMPIHMGDSTNSAVKIGPGTQDGNQGVGIVPTSGITPTGETQPKPGVNIPGGFPIHVGDSSNPALGLTTGTKDGSQGTILQATGPVVAGGKSGPGLVIPSKVPIYLGDASKPAVQFGTGTKDGNTGVVMQLIAGILPTGGILGAGLLFGPDVPIAFGDGNNPALKLAPAQQGGNNLSLLEAAKGFAGLGGLIIGDGMKVFFGGPGKPGLALTSATGDDLTQGIALADSATPGVTVGTDLVAGGKLSVTGDTTVANLTVTGTFTGAGGGTATEFTGTTLDPQAFSTVFDKTSASGLIGAVSLKNTNNAGHVLNWRITAKDMFGNVATSTANNLSAQASTSWDLLSNVGLSGVAFPFQEFKLEVEEATAGQTSTYDVWLVLAN